MRINRFFYHPSVRSDSTPGSLSPRCFNLFIGHSKYTVCPGLCTFKTVHERLDLFLRSPRNLTSLGAVAGAVVPTLFFSDCQGRYFSGACCSSVQPGHSILLPLPRLFPRIPRLGIIPLRLREVRSSIFGCCGEVRWLINMLYASSDFYTFPCHPMQVHAYLRRLSRSHAIMIHEPWLETARLGAGETAVALFNHGSPRFHPIGKSRELP
ncbi:hypothetical protein CRG98_007648 [Punica granatum]|uniref:Uncharacterized protein n=1 Tax=Punica granatum TaxID=22663 RepID=A0A2I0KU17_PUNGR|nr:hypothetical protein CRG98_007648 [Punica granatum]